MTATGCERLPAAALTAEEQRLLQRRLLALLEWQLRRYTGEDSSSAAVELAQELLRGLCFCLGIFPAAPAARLRALLKADLQQEYERGVERLRAVQAGCEARWRGLCQAPPPAVSTAMADTLRSIGELWRAYDPVFFPLELPCSIDYQLACPVPETLAGIDYAAAYLARLDQENRFLRAFPAAGGALMRRFYPDWPDTILNVFEPVFAGAAGCAVLGRDVRALPLSAADGQRLGAYFQALPVPQLRQVLRQACRRVTQEVGLSGAGLDGYLCRCADSLAARTAALRDAGGTAGIFWAVGP